MPKVFDRCVQHLMDNPDFKPRTKGQTKKDAAYAVCSKVFIKKYGMTPREAKKRGMANVVLEHERALNVVRKLYGQQDS
jgi:hypothetical protein